MNPWFLHPHFFHLINLNRKECYHELRFEKDSRYYVIRLSKDLLDDWVITLINGRIKSKLGRIRTLAFSCFDDSFEHFCAQTKLRGQRGYILKTMVCDNNFMLHLLPYLVSIPEKNKLPQDNLINKMKQRELPKTNREGVKNKHKNPVTPQQMGFSF